MSRPALIFKLHDKRGPLTDLGKHLGIFGPKGGKGDPHEMTVRVIRVDIVNKPFVNKPQNQPMVMLVVKGPDGKPVYGITPDLMVIQMGLPVELQMGTPQD